MKVRRLGFDGAAKKIVNTQGHGSPDSASRSTLSKLAPAIKAGKRGGKR